MTESQSQPNGRRNSTDRVTIDVDGHTLSAETVPNWLTEGVAAHRRAVGPRPRGYVVGRAAEPLLGRGITRANGGLVRAFDHLAAEHGAEINWRQFGAPLRALRDPVLASPDKHQPTPHFVDAVCSAERILVRYDLRHVKLPALVGELVHSFPHASFAIVSVSDSKRRQIANGLEELGVEFETSDGYVEPRLGSRVIVCSLRGVFHNHVELNHRHLVVFPYALEAIGTGCQDILRTASAQFRVVGFVPYGTTISPYEQDLVAGVYGFDQVSVPQHGSDATPVRIAWLPFRAPTVDVDSSTNRVSSLLRRSVWRHDQRNKLIARLARTLRNYRPGDKLATRFPDLPRELAEISPHRVVVATGTLLHAVELARWLQNWIVVADSMAQTEGLSNEQRSRLTSRACPSAFGTPWNVITTLAGLHQIYPSGNEVLIWAGSGQKAPLLPVHWLRRPSGDPRQVTIVDLRDHHHPRLREWSEQRRRNYRFLEWLNLGENPVTLRVRAFVSRRGHR